MIIHAPSYTFFILNILTIILCYAKFEGDLFFFNWMMTFSPTLLYLAIQMVIYLKRVIIIDEDSLTDDKAIHQNRFQLIDNLFHFLLSLLMFCFAAYVLYRLDNPDSQLSKRPIYIISTFYLFVQFLYTLSAKSMQEQSTLPISNEEKSTSSSILTTMLTPLFNFLGSSFMICSGGTCSTIYGSTISAIFGAFGISISEWLPYLDGVTIILVFVSVYVLYYAKQSLTYKPFMLGAAGAIAILFTTFFLETRYPIYVGNVCLIAAAIWNSKLNKAKLFGKVKHLA